MTGDGMIVGNADSRVSNHLKAWIKQASVVVVGVIGEGTTKELQSQWEQPFTDDSLGSMFRKAGGAIQAFTGLTSQTTFNTRLVWMGNLPHSINLVLRFYALSDARREVEEPIRELEKMASPDLNTALPAGRIPQYVTLSIGRKVIYPECVITGVSVPLDKETTRDGYLVRADVALQIQTSQMLNKSEIDATYG
mgnify:CR=1 FL=1